MSPRAAGRTQSCQPQDARTRLDQAEAFLEVAELVGVVRQAVALLQQVAPDGPAVAKHLDRLLAIKDDAHYGLLHVNLSRAKTAVRQARQLVEAAAAHVR